MTQFGYLQQASADALDDNALALALQALVVGVTGLDPTLVRPRWQPQMPKRPSAQTNWAAIGVTTYIAQDYPEYVQDEELSGTLRRLEHVHVLAIFYGPSSSNYASLFRDGLYIEQNLAVLYRSGLKLISADDITHAPEEINTGWIPRSDVPLRFTRMINRVYPTRTITSAEVIVTADTGESIDTIITQE